MGLRFRKSFKVAPGVKLNVGKKSVGLSVGTKGARVSVNSSGRRTTTVGIPGSGLSYSHTSTSKSRNKQTYRYQQPRPQRTIKTITLENNSQIKNVKSGFSWTTLFFGALPALLRRDFKWFTIILVIGTIIGLNTNLVGTYLVNLVFGFIYNKLYLNDLLKNGWTQQGSGSGLPFVPMQSTIAPKLESLPKKETQSELPPVKEPQQEPTHEQLLEQELHQDPQLEQKQYKPISYLPNESVQQTEAELKEYKCEQCEQVMKAERAPVPQLCLGCSEKFRSDAMQTYSTIVEGIYLYTKSKTPTEKIETLDNIMQQCTEMENLPYFQRPIFNKSAANIRDEASHDKEIWQNVLNVNRKTLKKEERDALLLKYEKRTLPYREYIAFDLETTGLKAGTNKVIEIAAVKCINGQAIQSFHSFVKPPRAIPSRITQITGITNEDVKDAESIEEVLPKFIDFIKDYPLVAHNASFDMSFINFEAEQQGLKVTNKVQDTLQLSRRYLKGMKEDGWSYKLGDVCSYLGYKPQTSHRALDDALAVAHVYHYISTYEMDS